MGFLERILGKISGDRERDDALRVWHTHARASMLRHADKLRGTRVLIKHQPEPGVREAALIIEMGLEDLGAVVTGTGEPYDLELQLFRYSGAEAMYNLLDAERNERDTGNAHHQAIVAKAIDAVARHA